MTIKLGMLRVFCTVAETGNLAEAAEKLGRTQSALSMSLKQLEAHLGRKLFEGERKSRLSSVGEQIFSLAQSQLRQFDDTVRSIETTARTATGLIKIASVPSVAALVFPQVLRQLSSDFPGVKIELRDTDTRQVLDALIHGNADIGIASGYYSLNDIAATPLFEDSFGLVGATTHPLLQQQSAPVIDEVVTGCFVRNAVCELITTSSFVNALKHVNITVHNNHSLINTISSGRWVSVLPESVSAFLPDHVGFRTIADLPDKRQVWLYRRERSAFHDTVSACCDTIKAATDNHTLSAHR